MKKIAVIVLLLVLITSQTERIESSAFDCMDACTTACVQRNERLMRRCERKCEIRCGPGVAVDVGQG